MKKNVGTWDALLRITIGFVGVAWAIGRMSRWPYRTGLWTRSVLLFSAMKIAEGITRFCPMFFALGLNSEGLTVRWKKLGTADAPLKVQEPSPKLNQDIPVTDDTTASPAPQRQNDAIPKTTDDTIRQHPNRIRSEPIRVRHLRRP